MATVTPLPVLDPSAAFARGGFGAVHSDPRDSSRCIKVLNEPLGREESRQLARLIDVAKWARPSDVETLTTRFAWPVEAFGNGDAITGFAMQRAPDTTNFELRTVRNPQQKTLRALYLMDKAYWRSAAVRSEQPPVDLGGRIEVALDLASALTVLHESGLCFGDVSSNNVAVNLLATPQVFLFDADSILTVTDRAAKPIHTPGWQVNEQLDPIETDRARFALFVTRLLAQVPNLKPEGYIDELLPERSVGLLPLLEELHKTGSIESFDALCDGLRHRRANRAGQAAFNRAVESQFARRVLAERIHAVTPSDRNMVSFAENQLRYEVAYVQSSGSTRRKELRRNNLSRAGFALDVPPTIRLATAPESPEELEQLVHLAMFEDIAGHLVNEGLGTLEGHSWLERAVQHALVEAHNAELYAKPARGKLSVRAWWPADPIVNVMQLTITSGDLVHTADMHRGDASHQMDREVILKDGGTVTVALRKGSESPSGTVVWDPGWLEETREVPPLVEPEISTELPPPSAPVAVGTVIDPVAQREQEILERLERRQLEQEQRKQRARRLALLSMGAVVASVLAVPAVRLAQGLFSNDGPTPAVGIADRNPDLRAGHGYVSITMAARTSADNDEQLSYVVDWGQGQPAVRVQRRSAISIATDGFYKPTVTARTEGSLSEIPIRGSLLVANPERRPQDVGLPAGTAIGVNNDGIYVHLGPRHVDNPDRVALRFTRQGDTLTRRIDVAWQDTIPLPISTPGTWFVSMVVSDRVVYHFPAVTLDLDHQATLSFDLEMENP